MSCPCAASWVPPITRPSSSYETRGHVWEATDRPVCFYCPVCADSRVTPVKVDRPRSKQRRNLEVIQRLAEARGGTCLSTTYHGEGWQRGTSCLRLASISLALCPRVDP